MKKILSYLLLLVLLANSLQSVVIYAAFKLNQDYIAKVLCINKDNAEVPDCKGSCHLTKEISKAANHQSGNDAQLVVKLNDLVQIVDAQKQYFTCQLLEVEVSYFMQDWHLPTDNYQTSLGRPPTFS